MDLDYFEGECIKRLDYKDKKVVKKYSKKSIEQQKLLNLIDGRIAAEAALKHGISAKCITINYYGNQTEAGSYALVYAKGRRCKIELTPEMVAATEVEMTVKIVKEVKKKSKNRVKGKARGAYKSSGSLCDGRKTMANVGQRQR